MKKVFTNSIKMQCAFTDEGVTFSGPRQDAFYPYGSIESIELSLFGVLQVVSRKQVCGFTAARGDKGELKQMVRYAREAMQTAPKAEARVADRTSGQALVSGELPAEEQLKQYKALFIRGAISREEYDARKRLLKEE